MSRHASHPDIVNRLKRADGHLQKIIRMVEDGRPCADLAQQLTLSSAPSARPRRS